MNRLILFFFVFIGLGLRGVFIVVVEVGVGMLGFCMVCLGDFWGWVNWGDFFLLELGLEFFFEDYNGK